MSQKKNHLIPGGKPCQTLMNFRERNVERAIENASQELNVSPEKN